METIKESFINECKKDIEKNSSKQDTRHLIENYVSIGLFFLSTAVAAVTVLYSVPVAIGAATASLLSLLYNVKSTKEFSLEEKKNAKILRRLEKVSKEESIDTDAELKMSILKYIQYGDALHENTKMYENFQMASILPYSCALLGMGLSVVAAPVALALDIAGLIGAHEMAKKELSVFKRKEALEVKLKELEFQINTCRQAESKTTQEEAKEDQEEKTKTPIIEYEYPKIHQIDQEKGKILVKEKKDN